MYQEQRFYKTLIVVVMIIGMLAFLPQILSFVSSTLYTVVDKVMYDDYPSPTPSPTDTVISESPSPTDVPSLSDRLDEETGKYRP